MYTVVLLYIRGRYHYFNVNDLYRKATLSMSRGEAREAYLIKRGKTLSPDGLNRKDEC